MEAKHVTDSTVAGGTSSRTMRAPPVHRKGGWAQHITVTAAHLNCIRLPEGVDSVSAAAPGCRYMAAYRAVMDRGRVQPGQWLAVHGCGGVGLSAVQIAAAAGATVMAIDIDDRKLDRIRRLPFARRRL